MQEKYTYTVFDSVLCAKLLIQLEKREEVDLYRLCTE